MIRNRHIHEALEQMQRRLDLLDRTLVVNNPDSPRAAEVFEGLRSLVVRNVKATKFLEASLAQLDDLAHSTSDLELIQAKTSELLEQAGVVKVWDPHSVDPSAFQIVGEGTVDRVVSPAYVVSAEGWVVRQGTIEFSPEAPDTDVAAPEPDSPEEPPREEEAGA